MRNLKVAIKFSLIILKMWTVQSQSGVSILFMGESLINGSSVICVTDIGEVPFSASPDDRETGDALVCVTNNTTCCRGVDGLPGGAGEWFINGETVPGLSSMPNAVVYRNRGTGLVRLNVRAGNTANDTGDYCCKIPDSDDVIQTLCVRGGLDDSTCNPPTTIPGTANSEMTSTTTTEGIITTTEGIITTAQVVVDMTPTIFSLAGVIVILTLIVLILAITLILFCKYHQAALSSKNTYSPENNSRRTHNAPDPENKEAIELNVNQAYGEVHSSSVAPLQSVDYQTIPEVLGDDTSQCKDSAVGIVSTDSKCT